MLNNQIVVASTTSRDDQDQDHEEVIRDIYALTPPDHRPVNHPRRREAWETSSHRSSSLSMASSEIGGPSSTTSTENFTSISREFNALVIAGSSMANNNGSDYTDGGMSNNGNDSNLTRIGEETDMHEETNPLAIVPDNYNHLNPSPSSPRHASSSGGGGGGGDGGGSSSAFAIVGSQGEVSVQTVKKEEVQTKISAWQTAKVAKINNRFKREEAVINGWESEQVQKATSWMKKVERKLEEKRAKALEKMQNDIAKARRKAEEKRASAEAKRGTKSARVFEIANLMKAVGRAPAKRSFF